MAIDVSHVCCSRDETKLKVDLSAAVFIHKLTQIYITLKNKNRTINLDIELEMNCKRQRA